MKRILGKWLSVRSEKEYKRSINKTLLESITSKFESFFIFIKEPMSFMPLALVIILLFILCLYDFRLPGLFSLTKGDAIGILDNRLSDLIKIFSISVTVAVFLVSALQAQRANEEQFSTIFRESFLYPIMFFILSAIGVLTVISYLKNSIPINPFIRMVVLELYIFVFALILIGFLFVRIFHFISTDHLLKQYLKQLKRYSEKEFLDEFKERISRKLYQSFMEDSGLETDLFGFKTRTNRLSPIGYSMNVIFKDVNMKRLAKLIKKFGLIEQKASYKPIGINDVIYEKAGLMIVGESVNKKMRREILKCYKVGKIKTPSTEYENQKQRLKSRLIKVVIENDLTSVDHILEAYYLINEAYAKKAKEFNIEGKLESLSSKDPFDTQWQVLKDLDRHLFLALEKAAEENNREIVLNVIALVYKILNMAIYQDSIILFRQYFYMPIRFYRIGLKHVNFKSLITSHFSSDWTNIIRLHLNYLFDETSNIHQKERLNAFYYLSFTGFSAFIKIIIDSKDIDGFNQAIQEFNQLEERGKYSSTLEQELEILKYGKNDDQGSKDKIKELETILSLEKQSKMYFKALRFGIQSWIWYLFRVDKITNEECLSFSKNIVLPNLNYAEKVNEYLSYTKGIDDLFDWSEWDTEERPIYESYQPLSPRIWLTFGFILWMVRDGGINEGILNEIENSEEFLYRSDEIKVACDYLDINFSKWTTLLVNISKQEIQKRTTSIRTLFNNLKQRIEHTIDEEIVAQDLSTHKIEDLKIRIGKSWQENGTIRRIFEKFNTIQIVNEEDVKVYYCGMKYNLYGGKMMFVEQHHQEIYGMESYGSKISECEDNTFVIKVIKEKKNENSFDNVATAIDTLIEQRKSQNKNTNIILISSEFQWKDKSLSKNEKFVPDWRSSSPPNKPFIGKFDNISIAIIHQELFKNTILVADFPKAFQMLQKRDPIWFNQQLKIEVSKISESEADKIFQENPNNWAKDKEGNKIEKDNAILNIKKGIIIEVAEFIDFKIIDLDEYDMAKIILPG